MAEFAPGLHGSFGPLKGVRPAGSGSARRPAKTDDGDLFPQDHRANGKLQPDHPGDYTSLRAAGCLEELHGQPAESLQLHQRGRHAAGEERPAAADDAAGLAGITDHHHPLLQLVCVTQRFS